MVGATPAISVLLPVRNGMPHLPFAVDSVLAQSWRDFELIVVEDGSTDSGVEYLRSLSDPRLRVVSSHGAGLGAALNTGLGLARAAYVARQDADDWSAPERLARQIAWLDAHQDVDVLATSAAFIDERGAGVDSPWTRAVHQQWDAALTPEQIAELMPLTCCIFHATVLARTRVLRDAGGYDQAMVPAEDYDLWLRLLPQHKFARLPERLYTVRVHGASSSALGRHEQTARVIAAKLRFVRRQVPDLPLSIRLVLPCDDRGAAVFRAVAPAEGYETTPVGDPSWAVPDVIAVTDFSAVPRFAAALPAPGYRQFGNLFVRNLHRGR
jgi:glycosyltransferase involved in cell wall biosynthesis